MGGGEFMRKGNKYNAKKTVVDGITFDSKAEAARYVELKLLEGQGVIKGLERQVRFRLQEGFGAFDGKRVRPIDYVADFMYVDNNGDTVVEDVKGMRTDVYKLKKKLFLNKYPDYIFCEIKR